MPVPTSISQLSTTASLNSPDGAVDVPSSIDDYQRAHAAFIAQLYAGTVAAPTVIVPSATTTDIGAAASENVDISGDTTITGFGTVAEGINRKGRFTGVLTLTHNATSLILPGNADITTAANDRYEARSLGGGNWIVTKYVYANGSVISATNATNATNATTTTPIKLQCRAATTANITLAGGAPNVANGVTLAANDRILVKNQSTASENGIYYVTTLGTGANGTWTRATDADGAGELLSGMLVTVSEGTVNADSLWMLTTNDPITIGTTALTFARRDATVASTAEAQAFTENTKIITALRLKEALQGANQSLGGGGYQKLPGGLIIQWGVTPVLGTTPVAVTFPIAFLSGCRSVSLTCGSSSNIVLGATLLTATQFSGWASSGGLSHYYMAIGD
jgi:hypothetical protein